MRFMVLLAFLIPGVGMAQEVDRYIPVAETILAKAQQCEANWTGQLVQLRGAIASQQKQIEILTAERDALKPKPEVKPEAKSEELNP